MSSQYAQLSDLVIYGLPSAALGALTTTQQTDALIAASSQIDTYIRGRYKAVMPLSAPYPLELVQACCKLAAYELLQIRGYNPASGADRNIFDRFNFTVLWLRDVQRGAAHLDIEIPASAVPQQGPSVVSSSAIATGSGVTGATRGW